ncbi:hypothetical protein GPECTOR_70g534 [Gonium pectorale]|uniref:Glycoside hydrolase family 31 N-terminal domain-containing protein n=1 Tax=Gonium pectorale TaxID=33097 RepID=A0A150G3A8_GONPE|nr:hypothetical protein GPECTOR_70g534 [Gonium pectorale]|eukprot:KXZ44303.1 hypothetical protein GPECTOR_70g534 [Gonium pectorale]
MIAPSSCKVWSGPTHWPDFLHPNATPYWSGLLAELHARVPFDGLWLDMNEPSNFCNGDDSDPLSSPPYRVNNGNRHAPLYKNTLPLTAVGYGGVRQYDAHNLYALAESRTTYGALQSILPGSRPFILTRSSWAGQGRYAAHWTGDNAASWDDLRRSVGGLLSSSLAGMAMAGADICGFMGATSEQLCARWLAAGAFYTFARDHSDLGSPPQEAYRLPAAAEAARNALRARYTLLPYLYTAFHTAHTQGGLVARPLAWASPDPANQRVADLVSQWLLGDALMVAPVLAPDTDWVEVHFPGPVHREAEAPAGGTWCKFGELGTCFTGPSQQLIHSPLGSAPPLFLRSGFIVPTQPSPQALTTAAVAGSPLTLTAVLSAAGSGSATSPEDDWVASGCLYADNGTSVELGGPSSLQVAMSAGASLGTGSGWFEYRVVAPPLAATCRGQGHGTGGGGSTGGCRGRGVTGGVGGDSSGGVGGKGRAGEGEGEDEGAGVDVRRLRVDAVEVVGVPLLPGCPGLGVAVNGAPVPPEQVQLDMGSHVLYVRLLHLAAFQSFRLTWQAQAAPGPAGPAPESGHEEV